MRLLQAMAGAKVGGAETFFIRLTTALARAGIEQRVVTRPEPERIEALRAAGVPVVEARFGGRLDFLTGRRLGAEIRRFGPDIVLSWMNRATRFCPPSGKGARFVHVGTPRGYYQSKFYRHCDHLVCTTDDLVEYFIRAGWPRARITRISNFAPDNDGAPPASRAALDTPEDAPLLLALGRLHANKGFDTLLDAMAELPGHFLWLGGSGPLEAALKNQAARLGVSERVRFLGWRRDTPALFAAADVFVCSSRVEPFGNIVIEAWAQRVPVVAARATGPASLIAEGESGLLAPIDDGKALAQAIRRLDAEKGLAGALAGGGRAAYQAAFTEQAVVGRYLELFERLAA